MRKLAMLFGLLIVAAACSKASPTETAIVPAGGAALDGGTLAGSGNKEETTGAHTTASADSTGRGGTLAGSGN